MQNTFILNRSDFAELQKRILANAKAQLRRQTGTPAKFTGTWVQFLSKVLVWLAMALSFFVLLRWADSMPRTGTHLAVAGAGVALGFLVFWALAMMGVTRLREAMIADGGWFLSPQSIEVREDGIEQRSAAAITQWQWAGFKKREESATLIFLFLDNAVCLIVPKSILTPEAQALIEQRVSL